MALFVKGYGSMGLILWIDQNTFATSLLEKVFKKKNLQFYTIPSAKDFSYLVEDLRPELLVLDGQTILENLEAFKLQLSQSENLSKLPKILVEPTNDLQFLENVIGNIHRPFDPFAIPQEIQKMLSAQ